jgi:hypothetical protein
MGSPEERVRRERYSRQVQGHTLPCPSPLPFLPLPKTDNPTGGRRCLISVSSTESFMGELGLPLRTSGRPHAHSITPPSCTMSSFLATQPCQLLLTLAPAVCDLQPHGPQWVGLAPQQGRINDSNNKKTLTFLWTYDMASKRSQSTHRMYQSLSCGKSRAARSVLFQKEKGPQCSQLSFSEWQEHKWGPIWLFIRAADE